VPLVRKLPFRSEAKEMEDGKRTSRGTWAKAHALAKSQIKNAKHFIRSMQDPLILT